MCSGMAFAHLNRSVTRLYGVTLAAKASPMELIAVEKTKIRKKISELTNELDSVDVAVQSKIIMEKMLKSKWLLESKRISVYVSTRGEVLTDSLIRHCLTNEKEVFIPNFRRDSNKMDMIKLQSIGEFCNLKTTLWGIRQHSEPDKALSWVNFGAFDAVVLPGVAFTKEGSRLGHGKGYYDRFLTEHNEICGKLPFIVGLALEHQILDDLPVTNTDVSLDLVLTSL